MTLCHIVKSMGKPMGQTMCCLISSQDYPFLLKELALEGDNVAEQLEC